MLHFTSYLLCDCYCLSLKPALPKVLDDDDEEEEEPEEGKNYSTSLIDYVTIYLTSMQEIEKLRLV